MGKTEQLLLEQFQRMRDEMDRMFESFMPGQHFPARRDCVWCPPTDVYETADTAVVKVEIAGIRKEDFKISFSNNILVVTGVRRDSEREPRAYQQLEILRGAFRTEAYIPWRVNAEAIEAYYSDGFLTIKLPKLETQAKQIPIKTSEG